MRVTVLLLSVALVLFSFGTALGQDQGVYLHSTEGLNGTGGIDPGTSVTFKFGFKNDEAVPVVVVSHGIHVFTADGITWTSFTSDANPAYNWDLNFGFPCFFDLGFFYQQYFSDDGMLDDTLGIGGAKGQFGTGLPAGFNDWAVALNIGPVNGAGVLHIDSCFYPPAGYWMWGLSGGTQADCAWPGPFDFVVGTPPEPPVIAEIPDQVGTVGEAFYYDVEATGSPDPEFDFNTAPSWLAIDPGSGEITGTPTAEGTFPVEVIATNSAGTDTEAFNIVVSPAPDPPTITTDPPLTGTVGIEYVYDVDATGYPEPTIELTSGPGTMDMDEFGVITWIPNNPGSFDVTVTASNGVEPPAEQVWTIVVVPADEAPTITTTAPTVATVGALYTYDVDATGYPEPTIALTSGPTGMEMDEFGVITWTPTDETPAHVIVTASNGVAPDAVQEWDITVSPEPVPPTITTTPPTDGQVDEDYYYDADATGVPTPTFVLTSGPAGLNVTPDGVVTWIPTAEGDFSVTITAQNGVDPPALQTWTINVIPAYYAPMLADIPDQVILHSNVFTYTAEADAYPDAEYSLAAGAPAGMTIDPGTGEIYWDPDLADVGIHPITVVAENLVGTDTEDFNLEVVEYVPPTVRHEPFPINLKDVGDRIVWFYIENENTAEVNLETIRIHGKVPPYTEGYPTVEEGVIITNCFVFRFLSAYRPIPESETGIFTVTYNYYDGTPVVLEGDASIYVPPKDLTLDGYVNQDDVDLLRNYLWKGGKVSEFEEMMDINRDGRVDAADLHDLANSVEE